MSIKPYKIKAFTLGEVIIVILLTLIVVGLAFSVLRLVQKNMQAIQTNFENTTSVHLLEQSLYVDATRAKKITFDSLNDKLNFLSEVDTISYVFEEKNLVKGRDTFPITFVNKIFFFEGEQTVSTDIDAFKLIVSEEFQTKVIFVSKQSDAEFYINK